MSYGFYRMGSNVEGKMMPQLGPITLSSHGVAEAHIEHKPMPPALSATLLEGEAAPGPKLTSDAARAFGYTGNQCETCFSMRMKVAGHCEVCEECGSSSGCS